jgi:tetratricopeptide (TPR) repeat protein
MREHRLLDPVRISAALVLVLSAWTSASGLGPPVFQIARIQGRVLSNSGRPIADVRVTLKNDGYSPLRSVYTDSSGRFQFTVNEGAYYLEVDPLGTPFERHQERVDLNPSPFSKAGELFYIDLVLTPKIARGPLPKPDDQTVVFYQTVPDAAKTEYEQGLKLLAKTPDEAFAAMRRALQIFPDYYAAMETLGSEYVKAGHLDHALPLLLRAVDINPSGAKSYYALGVAFYQKKHYRNAVKAFTRVLGSDTRNLNALVYRGLSYMRQGRESEAEADFKKAYEVGATGIPEIQLALSEMYIDQKRYKEAAAELTRLLDENPSWKERKKIEDLIRSCRSKAKPETTNKG